MNEIQIQEIVDSTIKAFKEAENKKKIPEYTDVYKESVEYYERISIHSEIGKFPDSLFKKRAPNQTDEEFEYLRATYKTTSFPIWTRFMGFINRIWNDQNWSIKWPEENPSSISEDEAPQKYLQKDYPIYDSLESYYKNVVTPSKEQDANALLVHKPHYIPTKTTEEGQVLVDDTQMIKPVAAIYKSSQVVAFVDGQYAMVETSEKSWVRFGNSNVQEGKIYEFYDDQNIYKIVQVGKKTDYQFDIYLFWPHGLGYVPVKKLKGKPIQKEKDVLYQSHFMSAVEPMDDILLDSSYLRAIKAGHAFPHKWEYVEDCEYSNAESSCISGIITVDGKDSACPKCHGTGKTKSVGPLGVYQVNTPNQRGTGSSPDIAMPPFGWVAPDPAIMEFLRAEIDKNKEEALSILNLFSPQDVKGGETALGKQIDREESFSFVQSISNQNFDLFEFSHKCILQMRYGKGIPLPEIAFPKNFSIRNEAELTEELATAREKGLPDIALRKILEEYLNTRFNTQDETNKIVDLAFHVDRLVSLSNVDIAQQRLGMSVANWEVILHTSVYTFIAELMTEYNDFFDKEIEEQKKLLIAKAKKKDKEINKPLLDPDKIMANVEGEGVAPADAEAEAAARLRGSVGGAQVITGFVEKVSQGLMNRDAAIEGLKFLFKVDDDQAALLLGPIKKVEDNAGSQGFTGQ